VQVQVYDSMHDFDMVQFIATGSRSKYLSAECRTIEGGESIPCSIKEFYGKRLFNSMRLLSPKFFSEEEKVSSVPLKDLKRVYERFIDAAQYFSGLGLKHESLLQIKGVVAPKCSVSHFGLVFERFEGISLEGLISSSEGRLILEGISLELKLQRLCDIASALETLHEVDVLHRNLRDSNVLFSSDFQKVKVSDYALDVALVRVPQEADEDEDEDENEEDKVALLKVSALPKLVSPPELLAGVGFNEASDVYCFGMIAWELLSCQAHQSVVEDQTELIQKIVRHGLRPEMESLKVPIGVRKEISELLQECWNRKIDLRPDMQTVGNRLRKVLAKL